MSFWVDFLKINVRREGVSFIKIFNIVLNIHIFIRKSSMRMDCSSAQLSLFVKILNFISVNVDLLVIVSFYINMISKLNKFYQGSFSKSESFVNSIKLYQISKGDHFFFVFWSSNQIKVMRNLLKLYTVSFAFWQF